MLPCKGLPVNKEKEIPGWLEHDKGQNDMEYFCNVTWYERGQEQTKGKLWTSWFTFFWGIGSTTSTMLGFGLGGLNMIERLCEFAHTWACLTCCLQQHNSVMGWLWWISPVAGWPHEQKKKNEEEYTWKKNRKKWALQLQRTKQQTYVSTRVLLSAWP